MKYQAYVLFKNIFFAFYLSCRIFIQRSSLEIDLLRDPLFMFDLLTLSLLFAKRRLANIKFTRVILYLYSCASYARNPLFVLNIWTLFLCYLHKTMFSKRRINTRFKMLQYGDCHRFPSKTMAKRCFKRCPRNVWILDAL